MSLQAVEVVYGRFLSIRRESCEPLPDVFCSKRQRGLSLTEFQQLHHITALPEAHLSSAGQQEVGGLSCCEHTVSVGHQPNS